VVVEDAGAMVIEAAMDDAVVADGDGSRGCSDDRSDGGRCRRGHD
jgi:hypothetical protein